MTNHHFVNFLQQSLYAPNHGQITQTLNPKIKAEKVLEEDRSEGPKDRDVSHAGYYHGNLDANFLSISTYRQKIVRAFITENGWLLARILN